MSGNGSQSVAAAVGPREVLPPEEMIFGRSAAMALIRQRVEKVAGTSIPVLIQGDSGTGKEVLSRYIHSRSMMSNGSFVKVNCAAIPGMLLESELFGYQRGAFTGAYNSKPGRIEAAHGGTLFLDEIGELDLSLQAKLLQVLQDGRFCRIGDHEERWVEGRLICTTHHQLESEIENRNFRRDLFYRINVITIRMPRLRERPEDILLLAGHFLARFNASFQRETPPFSRGVAQMLQRREWSGNIRELENCIVRYVLLGSEEALSGEGFEKARLSIPGEAELDGSVSLKSIAKLASHQTERDLILKALQANHWNRRKTAKALRISYRALLYKIRNACLAQKQDAREPSPTGGASNPAGRLR